MIGDKVSKVQFLVLDKFTEKTGKILQQCYFYVSVST